jgi:opacity protein-like surface antigen
MRRLACSLVIAACAVALSPAVAWAQQRSPFGRLFVGAFGGLTATGAATDAAGAGRAGVTITRRLVLFGEGGRMRNVLPPNRTIGMERAVAGVYLKAPDTPVSVEAAYPMNYGLGGARLLVRSFFFEGGFGAASVHTRLDKVVVNGTDTTAAYLSSLSTGPDLGSQTVSLLAFGGGLNKSLAGPVSLDLAYRYTRINTFAPAVNSNMAYVGLSVGQHLR